MTQVAEKTLSTAVPHSREAEEAVLGAALINPDAIRSISWLKPDDFYIHRNRWIWDAMLSLDKQGIPVDLVTLGEEVEKLNLDVQTAYVTSLINQTPTSLNIEHYAHIVVDHAQRRNDINIANQIAAGAYSTDGVDRAHIIDLLTKNTNNRSGAMPIKSLLSNFYDGISERSKSPKDVWGISTGITMLDRATGGLQKQQTSMVAGAPGVGKTTLLLQLMLEAGKQGWKVGIYELEMDTDRLLARLVSMLTGVPIRDMKSGRMESHWADFNKGMTMLEQLPIYICDNPVMDTSQIRADVSRIKALHGLDLVGLDYLNLLTDRDSDDDNKNTTAKAVRFRQICREFDVAGVSVQSITKEGMRAVVPSLADMSGPAEVSFSADNVFFMVQDADSKIDFTLLPAKMRDSDSGKKPIPLRKPAGKIMFSEPARI